MAAAPSHLAATFWSWRPLAPLAAACPLARSRYRAVATARIFPRQVLLAVSIHRPTLRSTAPAASTCECRSRFLLPLMPRASRQHAQTPFSRRISLTAFSSREAAPRRTSHFVFPSLSSHYPFIVLIEPIALSLHYTLTRLSLSLFELTCAHLIVSLSLLALTRSQAAVALFIPSVIYGNVYLFLKTEGFVLI